MDATTFFLTYPQTDISHDTLYNFLQSIKPVVWARVAREAHEDGSPHLHCIVRFGARVKTRSNMALFDVEGRHPNIQVPRRIKDVLEYCAKDGNFQDYGSVPTEANPYEQLVLHAKACDRDAFDKCGMEGRVSFMWAEHLWKRHSSTSRDILEPSEGVECLQLQTLFLPDKTTIVVGASGCGKSSWAIRVAPKPALWVNHLDDLKGLTKEHKCIIFDDMDFKHLPRTTQIYLVDQDHLRTIHCRNTNSIIPAHMPKIFCCNEYCFIDDEAVNRRVQRINIVSWPL